MDYAYILGLTITGIISGLSAGFIGAGAEVLIVPLLTIFGILNSLKMRILYLYYSRVILGPIFFLKDE